MNLKKAKALRQELRRRFFTKHRLTERDRMYRILDGMTQANHFLGYDVAGRRIMGPRYFQLVRLDPGCPRDVYRRAKRTIVETGGTRHA